MRVLQLPWQLVTLPWRTAMSIVNHGSPEETGETTEGGEEEVDITKDAKEFAHGVPHGFDRWVDPAVLRDMAAKAKVDAKAQKLEEAKVEASG